jgi:hypothetical protein
MKRPTSITVVEVVAFCGAAFLALTSFAFLLVGGIVVTGGVSGDPVSVAITGIAIAGGFSLLILAGVTACLANEVRELHEWPRAAEMASVAAGIRSRWHSVVSWVSHTWTLRFH